MFNPVSTYRLQFHKDFTLSDLDRIIPYLDKLGIKTIYASPIFEAVPGSTHGYDGLNPLKINPEIGSIRQLRSISKKLKSRNISWIQDIVPNHMAFHPDNPWLMDVLEKGPSSPYKDYFDQSLSDELFNGPLMVPFLGSGLDEVIDKGELNIEAAEKKFVFNYAGSKWPLRNSSYPDRNLSLTAVNQDKKLLKAIAEQQYYRLCSWKETNTQINFRRFFTVNGLICLNIQNDKVFAHFHQLINDLLKEEVFQGLRIDHIDGLYDPTGYLQQLRSLCGDDTYIIVEKILEPGEEMPAWPIQGNTGYDFLAMVNNLFTNGESEEAFTEFYHQLSGDRLPVAEQIRQKKAYILEHQMPGELDNLTHYFQRSGLLQTGELKRVSPEQIRETIAEFLVNCPVYRFYGNQFPLSREERRAVKNVFDAIKKAKPGLKPALKVLKTLWLGKDPKALKFYQRCMQFTGPLMAKGVEDTLMYTYNRFIAHNEVGDAPDAFGIGVDDFHGQMAYRQKQWPLSMNATSTHDTKRGEDARARLNVLTDMAGEWLQTVLSWREMNRTLIKNNAPDANDEYFIYETLAGTYPMPGEPDDDYNNRVEQYLEKTLREAKLHSGWEEPNEAYEVAAKKFVKELLNKKRVFWKSFANFHQKISAFGVVNSLTQVLLKLTAPGVPDTYQGCELWDLSMVDPDNRRPVDYDRRNSYLAGTNTLNKLWQNKFTGQVKLRLLQVLLKERKNNPLVFAEGKYIPLKAEGKFKANVIAYARQYKRTWYVVAATLGMASISDTPDKFDWEDTAIVLPENIPGEYENLLSGTKEKTSATITVSTLLGELPLAFLKMQLPENDRASGILMHITSLPSPFGVGDLGPEAKNFADFLHRGLQKYWQLLPLSPVNENNQYSPYSSWSAMGGNTLLISPELLVTEGLLTGKDLDKYKEPETGTVDFKTATWLKDLLFDTAWLNYNNGACPWLKGPFRDFCQKEAYWLNDFALYAVLNASHDKKPWYEWPDKFKRRDAKALSEFAADEAQAIEKTQWLQFIFNRQWLSLKKHCNQLDIQLFGDLPFYVGYDSVDVWSH
ncbi:MAG: malto-oligosyltrehalose synthase, partial [Mucilaginibacter sp.]